MLLKSTQAVGIIEYLMLIVIVALGAIAGLNYFKGIICNSFNKVADVTKSCAIAGISGSPSNPQEPVIPDEPVVIIEAQ